MTSGLYKEVYLISLLLLKLPLSVTHWEKIFERVSKVLGHIFGEGQYLNAVSLALKDTNKIDIYGIRKNLKHQ